MRPALPPRPFVYPIVDAAALGGRRAGDAVEALGRGGARLVQVRAKGMPDRALLAVAREALEAARAAGMTLVVNDRPDVALLLGAEGVHVGQDDLPPRECRRLLGDRVLLGLSTHGLTQLRAATGEPVDYVAVGPVFPTRSKADPDPVVGLEMVRRARGLVSGPLVAIGGITRANARAVAEAGADGLAVISDLLRADDLTAALRDFHAVLGLSPGRADR